MYARNDGAIADPHSTTITHTVDPSTSDIGYHDAAPRIAGNPVRIDLLVIDDETPGVFVPETGGDTVVSACGATCQMTPVCTNTPSSPCDSYLLRLNKPPTDGVKVDLITDGQTDVDLHALRLERLARGDRRPRRSQALQGKHHDHECRPDCTRGSRGERLRPRQLHRRGLPEGPADQPLRYPCLERRLHRHRPRDRVPDRHAGAGPDRPSGRAARRLRRHHLGARLQQRHDQPALDYRGVYSGSVSYQQNYVTTLFNGGYSISGNLVTKTSGSSFLDAGFAVNMRIRFEGLSGSTDFVVTDVSDTQLTPERAPAGGSHSGNIDRLSGAFDPRRRQELARRRLPRGPAVQDRCLRQHAVQDQHDHRQRPRQDRRAAHHRPSGAAARHRPARRADGDPVGGRRNVHRAGSEQCRRRPARSRPAVPGTSRPPSRSSATRSSSSRPAGRTGRRSASSRTCSPESAARSRSREARPPPTAPSTAPCCCRERTTQRRSASPPSRPSGSRSTR